VKAIKYFNVYNGNLSTALWGELCFVEKDATPVSSVNDRTVTGPFDSIKEAQESFSKYEKTKKYFLFTEQVVFNLK
jgi:hypothetical protein